MVNRIYKQKVTLCGMNKAAQWLAEKRKSQNLSLRQLGKLVGLPHTTIAKAENGEASFETWAILAEHFGESPPLVFSWANKLEQVGAQDEWVLDITNKLTKLPPDMREVAEAIIKALRTVEDKRKK